MLVLSRRCHERLFIGDNIVISIERITPNNVRLGITAPSALNIVREELACTCERDGRECAACMRKREDE